MAASRVECVGALLKAIVALIVVLDRCGDDFGVDPDLRDDLVYWREVFEDEADLGGQDR